MLASPPHARTAPHLPLLPLLPLLLPRPHVCACAQARKDKHGTERPFGGLQLVLSGDMFQ